MMNQDNFQKWMDALATAWTNLDPEAVLQLFADDAQYQDDPFNPPMQGRDAILHYWQLAAKSQKDVLFQYDILGVSGETGFAHWSGTFTRTPADVQTKADGILVVTLNNEGKCRHFREWWNRREH